MVVFALSATIELFFDLLSPRLDLRPRSSKTVSSVGLSRSNTFPLKIFLDAAYRYRLSNHLSRSLIL